jgi:hypothetical protein
MKFKKSISAVIAVAAAASMGVSALAVTAGQEGVLSGSIPEDGKYVWNIEKDASDSSESTYYEYSDDVAAIKIGINNADKLIKAADATDDTEATEASIYWAGRSGGSKDDEGAVSNTNRYIEVTPKYDGTFNITAAFTDSRNTRLYYLDETGLGTEYTGLDYCKKNGQQCDFSTSKQNTGLISGTKSIAMTKDHTYIIWAYAGSTDSKITLSGLNYTSDDIKMPTEPTEPTEPEDTDTTVTKYITFDGVELSTLRDKTLKVKISDNGEEKNGEKALSGLTGLPEGDASVVIGVILTDFPQTASIVSAVIE